MSCGPRWWILAWLVTACSSNQSGEQAGSVRDSAGIRIVEFQPPIHSDSGSWRVDTSPQLFIGTIDGAAERQFTDIRGIIQLTDGRLVVANGRTQDIRCFSSSGEYLWTAGRSGKGPGDFVQLATIKPYRGDSIIAFDFGLQRYSIISPDGRYARSWTPEVPEEVDFYRNLALEGSWPDGSVALRHSPVRRGMSPPQVTRKPIRLFRYSPEGRLLDRIGEFPGAEWYEGKGFGIRALPFGRNTRFEITRTGVLAGTDDTWEFRELAMDGRVVRIIRHVVAPQPINDAEVASERKRARLERQIARTKTFAGMPDSILAAITADEERMFDEMPFPRTRPAFSRFMIASDSTLWVEEYRSPSDSTGAARWNVHDRDGHWLAAIALPTQFTLYAVLADRLLGVQRDDLDVESVVTFRIIR